MQDRVSVIQIVRIPQTDNSLSARLYRALISLDTEVSQQKVNGSIQLHYSEGLLNRIKLEKYY